METTTAPAEGKLARQATSWVTLKEAYEIIGISRGTFLQLKNDPKKSFPQPIPMGIRTLRFNRAEIEAYRDHGVNWKAALSFR
jgi:predicted DNA-binding transcriptional regulator AlpA